MPWSIRDVHELLEGGRCYCNRPLDTGFARQRAERLLVHVDQDAIDDGVRAGVVLITPAPAKGQIVIEPFC